MSTEKTYLVSEKRLRSMLAAELERSVLIREKSAKDYLANWAEKIGADPATFNFEDLAKLYIDKDYQCITSLS